MDQLVDVLQSDPVLTAQLMRLANSSLFPGKSEVTNVGQASMKLGFRQLRTMSLSMSLLDEAEGGSRSQFPHELYQRYSLCWSIGAQTIGDRMGLEASELFLGGLLAPMGHMILAACYPELYGRLLVEARGELPLEAREYDLLGSDAPLACAMLLESWELPNSICE
jgi:HD-like signal output (HDOD) protein